MGPKYLVSLAVAGTALYLVTLLTVALLARPGVPWLAGADIHLGPWWVRWLLGIAIFVPGLVIELRAMYLLRDGIRLERWSEEEIAGLRDKVQQPLWKWLTMAVWVGAVMLVLLAPRHSAMQTVWLFAWLPVNLLSSLQSAFRKPTRQGPPIDWSKVKPLQSKHWGGVGVRQG